jgi:dienelactone hydrolase
MSQGGNVFDPPIDAGEASVKGGQRVRLTRFYTAEAHLARRFERVGRRLGVRGETPEEVGAWQSELRAAVARCLGMDSFERCPPRIESRGRESLVDHVREDLVLETEPDVWMPFYVLLPQNFSTPRPAVLAPHGHGSAGKFPVAGRRDIPAVARKIEESNYDYGVQLVRRGFVVFCPDARGHGERREETRELDESSHEFLGSTCHHLSLKGEPLGQSVAGMWTWDLMRLLDYAETRPEVDARRIGCAGLSGGGLQTLFLAALDERVRAAVVSGYFYGVKESLLEQAGNCDCNIVPGLWLHADMGDIGGLVAPRGLFIETGDIDPLNGRSGLDNVYPQVELSRQAFAGLGAAGQMEHHVFQGPHRWDGTRAIPWLATQLGLEGW